MTPTVRLFSLESVGHELAVRINGESECLIISQQKSECARARRAEKLIAATAAA